MKGFKFYNKDRKTYKEVDEHGIWRRWQRVISFPYMKMDLTPSVKRFALNFALSLCAQVVIALTNDSLNKTHYQRCVTESLTSKPLLAFPPNIWRKKGTRI